MTLQTRLSEWLQSVWYQKKAGGHWLLPVSWIFQQVSRLRRCCYKIGLFNVERLPVPIIIIGNISVGGTGKTPLIIWLAGFLQKAGFKPGIISRGYGGQARQWPQRVDAESDAGQVGDEALVIFQKSQCPMVVGPVRVDDAKLLLREYACDVILSDDGLQHYALARDIEIAVIDGERRFGNGHCLPAGPLREPISRLNEVDLKICNGAAQPGEHSMRIEGDIAVNMATGEHRPLAEFQRQQCHALAGIGNPQRFYTLLMNNGIAHQTHSFPDHYDYQAADIQFPDNKPVLMTEKDAVKCTAFVTQKHWYIPVRANPDPKFSERLLQLLREKNNG